MKPATPPRVRPAPDHAIDPRAARRRFLRRAALVAGGALTTARVAPAAAAADAAASNLPPNVPAWNRVLGTPILASPYGVPSKYEANVRRRESPGLTRTPLVGVVLPAAGALRHHHAERPAFRAPSPGLVGHRSAASTG